MSESERLIPWFVPSLAALLGAAEKQKRTALSPDEICALRDAAPVLMVKAEDVPRLQEERGYRDVDPEDAPADWFRLRVEMSGVGYLPKIVWCMVGDAAFGEAASALLREEHIEHEVQGADARMARAFAASQFRLAPSATDDERAAIDAHESVVYALSANYAAGAALDVATRMLAIAGRVLALPGAAGAKCESSGIAHGRLRWAELARGAACDDVDEAMAALVDAYVQYPIGDGKQWWSCGLHLLGLPDLIAPPEQTLLSLFRIFPLYLLLETGDDKHFASGHTFQIAPDAPRVRLTREACTGYDEDDFFFNPFGRWRVERA